MLVLTRKPGEKIMLGDDIVITFLENRGGEGIRIGIDAPRHVRIKRHEIFAAVADANRQAATGDAGDASAQQRLLGLLGGVEAAAGPDDDDSDDGAGTPEQTTAEGSGDPESPGTD